MKVTISQILRTRERSW